MKEVDRKDFPDLIFLMITSDVNINSFYIRRQISFCSFLFFQLCVRRGNVLQIFRKEERTFVDVRL